MSSSTPPPPPSSGWGEQQPGGYHQQVPPPQRENTGRTFSVIGAVLGVLALLFVPIVLGPIGAVLGFVGYSRGDRPLGLIVGIGSIVTTILGMVIGALLVASMS